jgi:anti-anti-sigma regulatory factor
MAVIVAADKPSRSLTTARNASRTGEVAHRWSGAVTTHETPALREELYRLLDSPGCTAVRLHVDSVTEIDHFGVALLIGANHRAGACGVRLILVDKAGPVTEALARVHVLQQFLVTQVIV